MDSYLVLARKWRPSTFADVIGQQHVTTTLQKAFEKGRLAHAYLFSGPRGCGKTTTARLLARIVNCETPSGNEPCNRCSSCLAVAGGAHLDMIEIDGASNRGIEEIRDLREKIGYAASQGNSKIYIIDEVHMLTPQAFNALLKTLEEPPRHVYFVFATTEPHKVPPTILSRCQRFNFKRLELSELQGQLERICAAEGIAFDREALLVICRSADGSMRDAESLLDQCIAAADGRIDIAAVRGVLGLVDTQIVIELLDAVSRRDRRAALALVDRVVSAGLDLEEFLVAFVEGIRNLLVIVVAQGKADWLDLTGSEIEAHAEIAKRFTAEDLLFLFRSMSRSLREFRTASRPRYHLEAAVTEAAAWESAVEVGQLLRMIGEEGGRRGDPGSGEDGGTPRSGSGAGGAGSGAPGRGAENAAGPAAPEPPRPAPDANAEPAQQRAAPRGEAQPRESSALARLGGREQWERFLAQVRESKLTLGIWLMSADVAAIEGERLILSFSPTNRFAHEMISDRRNRRLIETHLERFYGRKFIVATCENAAVPAPAAMPDERARREFEARSKPARAATAAGEGTVLRRIMDEFGGEIESPGGSQ